MPKCISRALEIRLFTGGITELPQHKLPGMCPTTRFNPLLPSQFVADIRILHAQYPHGTIRVKLFPMPAVVGSQPLIVILHEKLLKQGLLH